MARSRLIKPGFFTNDLLADCPPLARILFAGIWTLADREGKLEDRPKRIKAEILPFDSVNVDKLLECLHNAGFISRYRYGETDLIQISAFLKHQSPHPKEPASKWPDYDGQLTNHGEDSCEPVARSPLALASPSLSSPSYSNPSDNAGPGEDATEVAEANVGSPLPKRILTPAIVEDRREKNPDLDVDAELLKFRNHPWKKPPRDYVAAFDNWLTNARKYAAERNGNGHQLRTNPQQNNRLARTAPGPGRVPDMVVGD